MKTSKTVAPDGDTLNKPKVISLRFKADDEYDQATLQALNNVRVDSRIASECYRRSLPNKAMYLLGMVLGARPYTLEALDSVLDVMKAQRELFLRGRDKKPSHESTPVENPLAKNGLRLVK